MTDARQAEPRNEVEGTNSPDKRKEEIALRLSAATPGKRRVETEPGGSTGSVMVTDSEGEYYLADVYTLPDADFIANAPEDLRWALSRIETLEDEVRSLRLAATPGCDNCGAKGDLRKCGCGRGGLCANCRDMCENVTPKEQV